VRYYGPKVDEGGRESERPGFAFPLGRLLRPSIALYPTVVLAKLVMGDFVAKGAAAFGAWRSYWNASFARASSLLHQVPGRRRFSQRKASLLHQVPGRRREAIAGQGAIWRDDRVGSPLDSRIASLLK
jgi:hypothetical protein